jgi:hypothetical protein
MGQINHPYPLTCNLDVDNLPLVCKQEHPSVNIMARICSIRASSWEVTLWAFGEEIIVLKKWRMERQKDA